MSSTYPSSERVRVDLHAHTRASADAWTSPAELVKRAAAAGLDRIAVTDHGEMDGALEAQSLDPARVIVGQEITCRSGTELIGLFLSSRIPMRRPLPEVVERIRDQGGLVYAPHPFAYPRRAREHAAAAIGVADLVEVFNSRAFLPHWNRRALDTAQARSRPAFAGSDAHFPWELGRAYTEIPPFATAEDLLRCGPFAVPVGLRRATPLVHVGSIGLRLGRSIMPSLPFPAAPGSTRG